MENNFYNLFKRIIRECNYTNTYKMAWAKALVEISLEEEYKTDIISIDLQNIANKFIKYYWNQTIFFDLIQGSNLIEIPLILQYIKNLIRDYYSLMGTRKPDRFERIEEYIKVNMNEEYNDCLTKTIKTLKADVSWRFTFIDGKKHDEIYKYNKGDDKLEILALNLNILKDNHEDLFDLINYRWGLILETFNSSPRINKKVKIIDEQDVKRSSLSKFKEYLDIENPQRICFICGKHIDNPELSIDHVIPWSYLYSDDLWNLVYVHKSCNSSKSNIIPLEEDIQKLKDRNKRLLQKLEEKDVNSKIVNELELSIQKDYVNKFWIGCKS